jgi:hypothetical protein
LRKRAPSVPGIKTPEKDQWGSSQLHTAQLVVYGVRHDPVEKPSKASWLNVVWLCILSGSEGRKTTFLFHISGCSVRILRFKKLVALFWHNHSFQEYFYLLLQAFSNAHI